MFLSFPYDEDDDLMEIASEKSPIRGGSPTKNKEISSSIPYKDLQSSNNKIASFKNQVLFDEEGQQDLNKPANEKKSQDILKNTYKTKYTESSRRHQKKLDMIQASELENLLKTGIDYQEASAKGKQTAENNLTIREKIKFYIFWFWQTAFRFVLTAFGLDSSKDTLTMYWGRKIRLKYWIIIILLVVSVVPLTLLSSFSVIMGVFLL